MGGHERGPRADARRPGDGPCEAGPAQRDRPRAACRRSRHALDRHRRRTLTLPRRPLRIVRRGRAPRAHRGERHRQRPRREPLGGHRGGRAEPPEGRQGRDLRIRRPAVAPEHHGGHGRRRRRALAGSVRRPGQPLPARPRPHPSLRGVARPQPGARAATGRGGSLDRYRPGPSPLPRRPLPVLLRPRRAAGRSGARDPPRPSRHALDRHRRRRCRPPDRRALRPLSRARRPRRGQRSVHPRGRQGPPLDRHLRRSLALRGRPLHELWRGGGIDRPPRPVDLRRRRRCLVARHLRRRPLPLRRRTLCLDQQPRRPAQRHHLRHQRGQGGKPVDELQQGNLPGWPEGAGGPRGRERSARSRPRCSAWTRA